MISFGARVHNFSSTTSSAETLLKFFGSGTYTYRSNSRSACMNSADWLAGRARAYDPA
eukprot:COSAG05_NODE_15415_length_370_cov_0.900369_2_plen_57_part_01